MNATSPTDKVEKVAVLTFEQARWISNYIPGTKYAAVSDPLEAIASGKHVVLDTTLPPADLAREVAKALEGKGFCVMPEQITDGMLDTFIDPQMAMLHWRDLLAAARIRPEKDDE